MFGETFDGFVCFEVVQGEEDVVGGGEARVCEAGVGVVVPIDGSAVASPGLLRVCSAQRG